MEDDTILPDGFDGLPADEPATEGQNEPVDVVETELVEEPTREPTEPVEDAQEPTTETPQMIKLKVDRGEREVSVEEAAVLAQKGLNYERAVERAKQEARDAYIAEQGYTWNGKPITTEDEYKQATMEQDLIERYRDRDLPEEVVQELVENRKFRQQFEADSKTKAEQDRRNAELDDFLGYFQQENGRLFDPNRDTIPAEVTEAHNNGATLRSAYMEYQNKQLKSQLKVLKQNEENLKKAPVGSVTVNGTVDAGADDDFMKGFNSD